MQSTFQKLLITPAKNEVKIPKSKFVSRISMIWTVYRWKRLKFCFTKCLRWFLLLRWEPMEFLNRNIRFHRWFSSLGWKLLNSDVIKNTTRLIIVFLHSDGNQWTTYSCIRWSTYSLYTTDKFWWSTNKMTSYQKCIYCPPILAQKPFKKPKAFFFQNTVLLQSLP